MHLTLRYLICFILLAFAASSSLSQTFGTRFYIALPQRPEINDLSNLVFNYMDGDSFEVYDNNSPVAGQSVYHLIAKAQPDKPARVRVKYWADTTGTWEYIYDDTDAYAGAGSDIAPWMYIEAGKSRAIAILPKHAPYDLQPGDTNYEEKYLRVSMPTDSPDLGIDDLPEPVSDLVDADLDNSKAVILEIDDATEYGTVSVTVAHISNHIWTTHRVLPSDVNLPDDDASSYVRDAVYPYVASADHDLCHVLPIESLGYRYITSPSLPGRRALGRFGTCIVATADGTKVTITRPPAMPSTIWNEILAEAGSSETDDDFDVFLSEGDIFHISAYADRPEDYPCYFDSDGQCTTPFDTGTSPFYGPSAFAGLSIVATGAPVAVLNVEHELRLESDWSHNPSSFGPIALPPTTQGSSEDLHADFSMYQSRPYEASGSKHIIPVANPYIATGHNVRIMAYDNTTLVNVYRHNIGDSSTPLPALVWSSASSGTNVFDLEVISINSIDQSNNPPLPVTAGFTNGAFTIETDEVITVEALDSESQIPSPKRVSVLVTPRGDVNNGKVDDQPPYDPDLAFLPGSCSPTTSSGRAIGNYAIQVAPVSQFSTECSLAVSNTYDHLLFTTTLGLWDSYCDSNGTSPPELNVPGVIARNYVCVIADQDAVNDVRIEYVGYTDECNPQSGLYLWDKSLKKLSDGGDFSTSLTNECDSSNQGRWTDKEYTPPRLILDWQPCPGLSSFKYCLVQIPLSTNQPNDLNGSLSTLEGRRYPQTSPIRVYVDETSTVIVNGNRTDLLAAYLMGYKPIGSHTLPGPAAYGLSGVPVTINSLPAIVTEDLLVNDASTFEETSQLGTLSFQDTIATWNLDGTELPTPGETKTLEYKLVLNDLPPSSLRQMSEATTLDIASLLITRSRGADYLPVTDNPWNLEIETDDTQYYLHESGLATTTIYPVPVTKREVFDTYTQITDPASHLLTQVSIDHEDPNLQDSYNFTIPGALAIEVENIATGTFYDSGSAILVADAERPVRWINVKAVLGDSIDTDGNVQDNTGAGTGITLRVRTANTLTELYNKRSDPNDSSQIEIATAISASGDYLVPDNLPVARFLEIEALLHSTDTTQQYSPTVESIYAAQRPASLELSVHIENDSDPSTTVANLGTFNLSDAELSLQQVIRESEFQIDDLGGSGIFHAHASIRDGLSSDVLATASTSFEVLPEVPQTVFGSVTIEPDVLSSDDRATIASVVDNPNQLVTLEDVTVTVSIKNSSGTDIQSPGSSISDPLSYSYSIPSLPPGNEDVRPVQIVADTAFAADDYTVEQLVTSTVGSFTNTTQFRVQSSTSDLAGFAGTLSVGTSPVGPNNEDPLISATITNTGNEDLTNVELKFEFPHPAGSQSSTAYYPFEFVASVGSLAIGETKGDGIPAGDDPFVIPLVDLYTTDPDDPIDGLLAVEGSSYPVNLYATSDEHEAVTGDTDEKWVPIAVNAFLIRTGPGQVSLRRYIPIVLEPQGLDVASEGIGINRDGLAVGVSVGTTEYPAGTEIETRRASLWPRSRDVQDLHDPLLDDHGLTGSSVATSAALNINKDGYIVGQLDNDGNWVRSFIAQATDDDSDPANPLGLTLLDELLPSSFNSNQSDAFVTDISDEDSPTAVGYEITAAISSGSAGTLASGDPGLIGSGSTTGGELESGSITPGQGVSSSPTSSGGTALQGPGGSPSTATVSAPSAVFWPNAHSNPGRATVADLSGLNAEVQGSRFWAVNRHGETVGDWKEKAGFLQGLLQSPSWSVSNGGTYLDADTSYRGISSIGHIVGSSGAKPTQDIFQIRPNGAVTGLVPTSGHDHRYVHAINGNGEVVGTAGDSADQEGTAWANTTFQNPYLSLSAEPRTPWILREIHDINDNGQMVGTAEIPAILLGKGVTVDNGPLEIPEPLDVGSFFADSEGSGQNALQDLSDVNFTHPTSDHVANPAFTGGPNSNYAAINDYFDGVLSVDSSVLYDSETYGEVFYAPDNASSITITPVIDLGFGYRSIGIVRISEIQASLIDEPVVWAVQAIQNSIEIVQEHTTGVPSHWDDMDTRSDNPPNGYDFDYRMPITLDLTAGQFSWMANEPFAFYVIPNNTPAEFIATATNNGQDPPSEYADNLSSGTSPWYPGPEVPNQNTIHRPPLFSLSSANPESKDHMLSFNGSRNNGTDIETLSLFTFELITRNSELDNGKGSDRDFNDLLLTVEPALVTSSEMHRRGVVLDPVTFDIELLDRIRLWSRSDVGVIPSHGALSDSASVSRWWDFGTWHHPFGVKGAPIWEAVGGHFKIPGIRLDGYDDALEAVDIRYTDAAQLDGSFSFDLGDFIGNATFLMVIDLEDNGVSNIVDVPLFSTDKQLLRSDSLDPASARGRLGLKLDTSGYLEFQTQLKSPSSTVNTETLSTGFAAELSSNTVIIGLKIVNDDVYAIVNRTVDQFASGSDLSGSVEPVWTDITIGEDLNGDYGAFVIREVMMFDRGLDPEELEDITDYLMERYSISP